MLTDPKVSACMVLYHSPADALHAVSCLQESDLPIDFYVVDNSPDYPMAERIRWMCPGAKILPQERNLGFGRANNIVLPLLTSRYHLMINPDVTFPPDLISRMVAYMDANPDVVILTPRVFNPDGTEQFLPKMQPTVRYLLSGRLERLGGPFPRLRAEYTLADQNIATPVDVGFATGCFLLMHTGGTAPTSTHQLVTTIAASAPGCDHTEYALEGSVFVGGALLQWLRDELGLLRSSSESEMIAERVSDTGGVYVVPAFTGLGAPWWAPEARGLICGLTRGTTQAHVVRAALESMAYQVHDLARAMEADAGRRIETLNVDGGASQNKFLLQFQSDVLRCQIRRPLNTETTSLGAAFLAGLASGFWEDPSELEELRQRDLVFEPEMDEARADALVAGWRKAVERTLL